MPVAICLIIFGFHTNNLLKYQSEEESWAHKVVI